MRKEGIKLELTTGFGADKTATAVISGDADIAFMGPEATIYQFNEGNADYLINFAQLTQRAGNFVVSRNKEEDFQWENLKGRKLLAEGQVACRKWYLSMFEKTWDESTKRH